MASPAVILATRLRALEQTSEDAWGVYVSAEPPEPDRVITVYDTSGTLEDRLQRSGRVPSHPGVQVRVRAESYPIGWDKAVAVATILDAIHNTSITVDGTAYVVQVAKRTTDVLPLGMEVGTKRNLFTINARLTILP